MELALTEARPLDWLEALDETGRFPATRNRRAFGLHARQVEGGASIAVRTAEGQLCVLAGLYPDGDDIEAWFAPGPALRANLRPAMRLTRRALEAIAGAAAPVDVRCYVHPSGVAGARLAAWLGLEAAGEIETSLGRLRIFARRFA